MRLWRSLVLNMIKSDRAEAKHWPRRGQTDPASGMPSALSVLLLVDRERILVDDSSIDSSIYIRPWAKSGGLPLVNTLDRVEARIGRGEVQVQYENESVEAIGRDRRARACPPWREGLFSLRWSGCRGVHVLTGWVHGGVPGEGTPCHVLLRRTSSIRCAVG